MRFWNALVMIGLSIGAASCGGDAQPSTDNRTAALSETTEAPRSHTQAQPARASAQWPSNANARKPAVARGDSPPPDAQFTIFCDVIRGPGHVQRAMELKQELTRDTHREGWYFIHGNDDSKIYFGYYRTFEDVEHDPAETARAQNDRKFIESLRDPLGERRFKVSMFEPVGSPDPEAPREWDLVNTPPSAFWSIQVAAYQGSPERKKAAIDLVRAMREHGINAYYYHGDTISSVCIGTWPRSAVKEQDVRDDAHTTDPTQPIFVVSTHLPPGVDPNLFDKDGRRMLILAPKLEIMDETMRATLVKYPDHAVNGEVRGKVANGQTFPDPSFLVEIPHDPANAYSGAADNGQAAQEAVRAGADDAAAAILDQQPKPQSQQQQPGRLRSIGDR